MKRNRGRTCSRDKRPRGPMSFAIGSNYQAKCYFSRLKRIYLRSFLSSSVTNRTNVIVSGFEKEKRKNLAILIFIRQSTCSNLLSIFCPSRFMIQSSIAMWNKGNWLGLAIFHFFFIYIRRRSLRPIAFPFFFFLFSLTETNLCSLLFPLGWYKVID